MMRLSTRAYYARTILAIALVYLLVAKALFSPLAGAAPSDYGIPGLDLVICSAHEGASGPASPEHSHQTSCCDEGCLQRLAGSAAPLLGLFVFVFGLRAQARPLPLRPARRSGAPPWRIASSPGAQRAPPFCLI